MPMVRANSPAAATSEFAAFPCSHLAALHFFTPPCSCQLCLLIPFTVVIQAFPQHASEKPPRLPGGPAVDPANPLIEEITDQLQGVFSEVCTSVIHSGSTQNPTGEIKTASQTQDGAGGKLIPSCGVLLLSTMSFFSPIMSHGTFQRLKKQHITPSLRLPLQPCPWTAKGGSFLIQ